MSRAEVEGREMAQQFRDKNNLGNQPIGDLVTLIEQVCAADVAIVEAPADEHGMTMRAAERRTVFIAVACTENPMRQRSTLAHELGHVLFDDIGVPAETQIESRADAFARHLLLPLGGLSEAIETMCGTPEAEDLLSRVVQRFRVSPALAAIQLELGKHISRAEKDHLKQLTTPGVAARFGWSDLYRTMQRESCQPRPPQQLLARAVVGYMDNIVSVQQLAALRAKPAGEIEVEYREAGISPRESEVAWAKPESLPEIDIDLQALEADLAAGEE